MRLVMLGGPGSGKGTQAANIHKSLNLPIISTGGILREAIATQTPLGIKAQPYFAAGELLPDFMMIQFIRQRLLKPDLQWGWILEGYPRTAFQAEELDFLLEELEQPLNWAIYLEISEVTMMERSLARSLFDDQPEIIEKRIQTFRERTIPIVEYYQGTQRLVKVTGEAPPETVTKHLIKAIKTEKS